MRLIIVSGLSGAGKSAALHMLEDLDYYCIDNIPVVLLPEFALNIRDTNASADGKIAIGTDARAGTHHISLFPSYLSGLRASGIDAEVLFLSADISVILKRYSETRRKHPLTRSGLALRDAIERETSYLAPIAECADLTIDTSQMSVHDLRGLIAQRIGHNFPGLSLLFQSFGFKHGIPGDSDYIFDVRCLPNPHWKPHLRAKTGLDDEVMAYLEAQPAVGRMCRRFGFRECTAMWAAVWRVPACRTLRCAG